LYGCIVGFADDKVLDSESDIMPFEEIASISALKSFLYVLDPRIVVFGINHGDFGIAESVEIYSAPPDRIGMLG
jgi:hypothetical protein